MLIQTHYALVFRLFEKQLELAFEIDRFDQQNQHYGLTKQTWRAQNAAHFELSVFCDKDFGQRG
jgi:hypothetical protein